MNLPELAALLPAAADWTEASPLTRGIGRDKKYRITDKNGGKFLLRLSDPTEYENKKRVFDLSTRAYHAAGIAMPRPVDFGRSRDGQFVYMVLSWLEGEDFDMTLATMTEAEHYARGEESGRILRRLHAVGDDSAETPDWEARTRQRFDDLIRWYRQSGLRMTHDDAVIRYVEENLPLLQNRPQTILHSDYHIGNFVVQPDGTLGIIDFDFIRIGDPMEDARWALFTQGQGYTTMARGQVRGYHDGAEPPPDYFPLMAFYAALGLFQTLQWQTNRFPNGNIEKVIVGLTKRYDDFEGFRNPIPRWYREV